MKYKKIIIIPLIFLLIFLLFPLIILLSNVINIETLNQVFIEKLIEALKNSILISTIVSIISIIISYIVSYLIVRYHYKKKNLILMFLTLPMLVPTFTHALGFISIWGRNGLFNNTIDDEKLAKARQKMKEVLDNSVETEDATKNEGSYAFKDNQVIDLSKLNLDVLEKRIQQSPYKALNYEDLKAFIEKALEQMINRNQTRIKFSERYKNIIDNYNSGSTNSEEYFKQLKEYLASLQEEEKRAEKEGLTESELEIYDLLTSDKKLTSEEEKNVKLAAKNLYLKLKEDKEKLLVVDWYKDDQPMTRVRSAIEEELDRDLPLSYDKNSFIDKTNLIMNMLIDKTVQGIQIFY